MRTHAVEANGPGKNPTKWGVQETPIIAKYRRLQTTGHTPQALAHPRSVISGACLREICIACGNLTTS